MYTFRMSYFILAVSNSSFFAHVLATSAVDFSSSFCWCFQIPHNCSHLFSRMHVCSSTFQYRRGLSDVVCLARRLLCSTCMCVRMILFFTYTRFVCTINKRLKDYKFSSFTFLCFIFSIHSTIYLRCFDVSSAFFLSFFLSPSLLFAVVLSLW